MDRTTTNKVHEIKRLAEDVSEEDRSFNEATDREQKAEADLLALILLYVKDAIPAICSVVYAHYKGSVDDGDRFEWRGLRLDGGPNKRDDGVVVGRALYLSEEGGFRVLSYSGMWTKAGRRDEEWMAIPSDLVTAKQVVDLGWSVDAVAESIAKALREQADGSKAQVADRALERAAKLEAVAVLMGGVSW